MTLYTHTLGVWQNRSEISKSWYIPRTLAASSGCLKLSCMRSTCGEQLALRSHTQRTRMMQQKCIATVTNNSYASKRTLASPVTMAIIPLLFRIHGNPGVWYIDLIYNSIYTHTTTSGNIHLFSPTRQTAEGMSRLSLKIQSSSSDIISMG